MLKTFDFRRKIILPAVVLLAFCGRPSFAQMPEDKPFKRFNIYRDKASRDNHYVPSGYMPNGECIKMDESWQDNCAEGKSCIKVIYDVECSAASHRWAGVFWLNPADNWGDRKGGFNLTGATKLVFMAKGEKGGETVSEFKVGGVGINRDYPDSDSAAIGPVILTKNWRTYEIDLRGKDLSYISGGFAWASNSDYNPESCTFFLDDIHFE